MTSATLRVLWVCGAPAVGKSTAAWQLWRDLVEDDVPSAYVDIDQLGMLYPAPEGDEETGTRSRWPRWRRSSRTTARSGQTCWSSPA